MTDYDDDLDEMNLVQGFVLGFLVGGVSIGIISAAIVWNVVDTVAGTAQKVWAFRSVLPVR